MAHEIMEHDTMVSAIKTPWHGLGTVLDHFPSIEEAQNASGLTWDVRLEPVLFNTANGIETVDGSFITVRDDINYPLGIVGSKYKIYQNKEMFGFMDTFLQEANSKLETAGSLKNGRTVWAMAQAGTAEIVKDDPINKYFLFKNSFDGSSTIQVCFTDVRVVCNNTLTAALKGASNMFNIRHTENMHVQLEQIQKAIHASENYQNKMAEALTFLATKQLNGKQTEALLAKVLAKADVELEKDDELLEVMNTRTANIHSNIMDLVENGLGTTIQGVKGTYYGVLNAFTEYSDHYRNVRSSEMRSEAEMRFDSNMFGSSASFKQKAFNDIMKFAIAA